MGSVLLRVLLVLAVALLLLNLLYLQRHLSLEEESEHLTICLAKDKDSQSSDRVTKDEDQDPSRSLVEHSAGFRWRDIEASHTAQPGPYYCSHYMFFLAEGWPLLVEAVEKISRLHSQRNEAGWNLLDEEVLFTVDEKFLEEPFKAVSAAYKENKSIVSHSPLLQRYWEDCWLDRAPTERSNRFGELRPHFFRMTGDLVCNFLWMLQLKQNIPLSVDHSLTVIPFKESNNLQTKPQQNGGLRVLLSADSSSPIYGYWKPCTVDTGNGESYVSELLAYHLDRLLQINRAPAAVPRYFATEDLRLLAKKAVREGTDTEALEMVESAIRHCGSEAGVEGIFIGWSNFEVTLLDPSLWNRIAPRLSKLAPEGVQKLKEGPLNIQNLKDPSNIEWAVELMTGHMFGVICGTLTRYRHNQHYFVDETNELKLGPMIYIDQDRSQWLNYAHDVKDGLHFEEICLFPKDLSERILMLDGTFLRLGDFMRLLSLTLGRHVHLDKAIWTEEMSRQLQRNIHFLATTISKCIEERGKENVLIEDYWKSGSRDSFHLPGFESFYDYLRLFV